MEDTNNNEAVFKVEPKEEMQEFEDADIVKVEPMDTNGDTPGIKEEQVTAEQPSGEKPLGCYTCGKSFKNRSRLNFHMRTVHRGENNYNCE